MRFNGGIMRAWMVLVLGLSYGCTKGGGDEDSGGPGPTTEICDNHLDDDGNGAFDCNDDQCASDPACLGVEICANGLDDDGDGRADCDDDDCAGESSCVLDCTAPQDSGACIDWESLPGAIDLENCWFACPNNDPACMQACSVQWPDAANQFGLFVRCTVCDECEQECDADYGQVCASPVPSETCTGGADEDFDFLIDCLDPDCASDPACGGSVEDCDNGADDDGDSLVDCADTDCASDPACVTPLEVCTGGADEDGDGLVDCNDPDCANDSACASAGPFDFTLAATGFHLDNGALHIVVTDGTSYPVVADDELTSLSVTWPDVLDAAASYTVYTWFDDNPADAACLAGSDHTYMAVIGTPTADFTYTLDIDDPQDAHGCDPWPAP
jgi:hypothetical protein